MYRKSKMVIEPEMIPDFPDESDYNRYRKLVIKDFIFVKEYFPLLNLTSLPLLRPKEIFISGNLIPFEVYNDCVSSKDIERNSLYVLGIYPSDYPNDNIYVEDFHTKIDWSKIPHEHMHQNLHPRTNRKILCTHHPYGEINGLRQKERTVAILSSAWKLYSQYKEFLRTNIWTLPDLKHGEEGTIQLKKMGKYYGKKM